MRRKSRMPWSIQESAGPRAAVERENRATRADQAAVQRQNVDLRPIRSYCKCRYCKGLVEDCATLGVDRVGARVVFLNTTVSVVLASNPLRHKRHEHVQTVEKGGLRVNCAKTSCQPPPGARLQRERHRAGIRYLGDVDGQGAAKAR